MRQNPSTRLTIPRRLLLLTLIPVVGLLSLGGFAFHSLYKSFQSFEDDAATLAEFQREIAELNAFTAPLQRERDAALAVYAHRDDPQKLAAYRATFADTDRTIANFSASSTRLPPRRAKLSSPTKSPKSAPASPRSSPKPAPTPRPTKPPPAKPSVSTSASPSAAFS